MKVELIGTNLKWQSNWKPDQRQKNIIADLELEPIIQAASNDDQLIATVFLQSLFDPIMVKADLADRQATAAFFLEHPQIVQKIYRIVQAAIANVKTSWWFMGKESAIAAFSSCISACQLYLSAIEQIMALELDQFQLPAGVLKLNHQLKQAFDQGKLAKMQKLLRDLKKSRAYAVNSQLTAQLDSQITQRRFIHWHKWLAPLALSQRKVAFEIPIRDDNALNALGRLENRATWGSATTLLTVYSNLKKFFAELELQTAWLVGVTNLAQRLPGEFCWPVYQSALKTENLKNLVLLLKLNGKEIIGNCIEQKNSNVVLISGANQGGKTTFLRALGQAALLAEAGSFVCAQNFCLKPVKQVLTHFKREEDQTIQNGKLAAELQRMADLVNCLASSALVLLNESFTSTNEHEGSIINYQITKGLVERQVLVVSVSFQYEYWQLLDQDPEIRLLCLRAQRRANGQRTFKLTGKAPLKTSFGLDLFWQKFKTS